MTRYIRMYQSGEARMLKLMRDYLEKEGFEWPQILKNLPLSVIIAAMGGDGRALGAVLTHYRRYIRSLATRTLTDEYGNEYIMLMKKSKSVLKPVDLLHSNRFQNLTRLKAGIKEVGVRSLSHLFTSIIVLSKTYSKSGMF